MVPSPANSGFVAHVAVAGYGWFTGTAFRAKKVEVVEMRLGSSILRIDADVGGPYLAERSADEQLALRVVEDSALYRRFAELPAHDLDALAAFANEFGPLGEYEAVVPLGGEWSPPRRRDVIESARGLRYPSRDPLAPGTDEGTELKFVVETHAQWVRAVSKLRAAVDLLDAFRARNSRRVREVVTWRQVESKGDHVPQHVRQSAGLWIFDSHADRPLSGFKADDPATADRVYCPIVASHLGSPFDDVFEVALAVLVTMVNEGVRDVSPALAVVGGRASERLAPSSLLGAMWAQLYATISGGTEHRKCPACGGWFRIGGPGGATARRVFCSDACRVRACQGRRERAVELAAEGLTPKQVVERMAKE